MSLGVIMGLGKQSKTLNKNQIKMVGEYLLSNRYGLRDQTIFYFSVKCGLFNCFFVQHAFLTVFKWF